MKDLKFIFSLAVMMFVNLAIAQNDTIPNEYYGAYSAAIGHEDSGDEMYFCIGINGDKTVLYQEKFAGAQVVTYWKILSYDKKTGILKAKSEVLIVVEDEVQIIEENNSLTTELTLIKKGNNIIVKCEDYIDTNFVKLQSSEYIEKIILSKKGLPIKLTK